MNKQSAIALVLFFFVHNNKLCAQNFDINLLKPINKNETVFKNKYLELNASSVTALSVGLPAGIAIAGFIQHDKKLQRDALYMGGSFVLSSIITQATKKIVNRQRHLKNIVLLLKEMMRAEGFRFLRGILL